MAGSRPFVTLSAAVSIDGRIVTRGGDSRLSSPADLRRVDRLRAASDAVLVGKNTVIHDDPMLTLRSARGASPVRVVLDSRAEIPARSRILQSSADVPTIVAVSRSAPAANLARLRRFPVDIVRAGTARVGLRPLLGALARRGVSRLLVEGGGAVNWGFVRAGLFDEIVVTVCPYVVGGSGSVSLAEGEGFARVADSPRLSLVSAKRLENHLVLRYVKL